MTCRIDSGPSGLRHWREARTKHRPVFVLRPLSLSHSMCATRHRRPDYIHWDGVLAGTRVSRRRLSESGGSALQEPGFVVRFSLFKQRDLNWATVPVFTAAASTYAGHGLWQGPDSDRQAYEEDGQRQGSLEGQGALADASLKLPTLPTCCKSIWTQGLAFEALPSTHACLSWNTALLDLWDSWRTCQGSPARKGQSTFPGEGPFSACLWIMTGS